MCTINSQFLTGGGGVKPTFISCAQNIAKLNKLYIVNRT